MEKVRLIAIFLLSSTLFCNAQSPGDVFFSAPIVHDISITFLEPNWYDTLVEYKWMDDNLDSTVYLPATVTIDAVTLNSVGVKFKGNSSYYNYTSVKKPLNLISTNLSAGKCFMG